MKNIHIDPFKSTVYLIFLSMMAFACGRTGNLSFEEFDSDDDGKIGVEEFEETFTANYYTDWNDVDNQYLDDEDLFKGIFALYDLNNDGLLSKREWLTGYEFYYDDYTVLDYEYIDSDSDGSIDYAEFEAVDDFNDFYVDWNSEPDEYLTDHEIAIGLFKIWDIDESGSIEEDEYEQFDEYYLDVKS